MDNSDSNSDPYTDHPVLSQLPSDVRARIAEQVGQGDVAGAAKTLRGALKVGWWRSQQVIGGLPRPPAHTALHRGFVDKSHTAITIFGDGTFCMDMVGLEKRDRLVGVSVDIDSMRRKSVTGRGAAAVLTTGLVGGPVSLLAGNNRGVLYVTITGERSGAKTYTSTNPGDQLLTSVRSLKAVADQLLATHPSPSGGSPEAAEPNLDVAAQLKTLAELHAAGALSDDEFTAAKARLLS